MKEPQIEVGILFEPQLEFMLLNPYRVNGTKASGEQAHVPAEPKEVCDEQAHIPAEPKEMCDEQAHVPAEPKEMCDEQAHVPAEPKEMCDEQAHVPAEPKEVCDEQAHVPAEPKEVCGEQEEEVCGEQIMTYDNGRISWNGSLYDELSLIPAPQERGERSAFELLNVTIGIHFHWERKENQRFLGGVKIIVENEKLTAINVINVEDYLTSVISSEMSATASLELLKAHAVISRSWLLATSLALAPSPKQREAKDALVTPATHSSEAHRDEAIRWYDRSAHTHFHVCADDHCQRYQGITRASTVIVKQAIEATRGEVLMSEGKICDARYSKCCGGAFEEFQYCWEEVKHPYLTRQRDSKTTTTLPDLRIEAEAEQWIRSAPEAFCHTKEKKVLAQVLNNYDQETTDFYRWKVEYTQSELSELIKSRSGIDYGQILDLIPVERGVSGRLVKLKIVGTLHTLTIGKELEIRRTLSPSHLYSAAFVVDKVEVTNGIPGRFLLTGAGWGHGVGLCQIGAAMMGEQGYSYDTILMHYYQGSPPSAPSRKERATEIVRLYE